MIATGFLIAGLLSLYVAALSWLTLCLFIPLRLRRLIDEPTARSSPQPPLGSGGVVFVLVCSASFVFQGVWIPVLCLPLSLVGCLVDRHNLPAGLRCGVQLAG